MGTGIHVLTRQKLEEKERNYWLAKTAVGKIFTIGVLVALMVGVVFVYQVISSDITQRFGNMPPSRPWVMAIATSSGSCFSRRFITAYSGTYPDSPSACSCTLGGAAAGCPLP